MLDPHQSSTTSSTSPALRNTPLVLGRSLGRGGLDEGHRHPHRGAQSATPVSWVASPPDGRGRAVGRAAALAASDQAEAATGQGREHLRVVGRGAAHPPFGLRCWWARAVGDSSTTSEAQYSRRLLIRDPSPTRAEPSDPPPSKPPSMSSPRVAWPHRTGPGRPAAGHPWPLPETRCWTRSISAAPMTSGTPPRPGWRTPPSPPG
jgi:hypothetical protein